MKTKPNKYGPMDTKAVTAVMEDYLKAIFELNKIKKVVRVKDIAKELNVRMPSVTSMLKKLASLGLVKYRRYEYVELEDRGALFAEQIYRRHEIIYRFLADILTVEKKTASKEACKMEHLLSGQTLGILTDFINFMESCPNSLEKWPARFRSYRQNGCRFGLCEHAETNTAVVCNR